MTIKIYKNGFGAWEPTSSEWDKHKVILFPLCTSGCIAFRRKEDLIEFFAAHGITATEDTGSLGDTQETGQLMLF